HTFRVGSTLSEKVWERHVVRRAAGEPDLLYVDLHLVHEVTSPQAFEGLRLAKRRVRRPDLTLATMDHNVPTNDEPAEDISARQIDAMARNAREFGVRCYPMGDPNQGIVHVISPQLGLTQPGMTIVCGDSHTSTHGALGALAWGIGTSEIEHVLATQTIAQTKPGTMAVTVEGVLPADCAAKDVILGIIARIGTAGGTGKVIEYRGAAIRALSMEGRLTICNMSIEAGARAGMVAPDEVTFGWLEGRPFAPKGALWENALDDWRSLVTDGGASFDRDITIDAGHGGRGAGRSRSNLPRGRLRVARRGLLNVSRHESRCAPARRALRVDVEPELRGSSGARWTHAPRLARGRGGDRHRRTLRV